MSRSFQLTTLEFGPARFLMESILDSWGEDDPIVASAVEGEFDENQMLSYWAYLARSAQPGDLFLDVGSYAGLFSLLASRMNNAIRVAAFEAATVTYARLIRNVILNKLETVICSGHFAAWHETGTLDLRHRYGVYSMCPGESAVQPGAEIDHSECVPSMALDQLIAKDGPLPGAFGSLSLGLKTVDSVAAIKIDVEGAEANVLAGAVRIIESCRPHILCELLTEESVERTKAFLEGFNYGVVSIGDERNYHLVPLEKKLAFDAGYKAWMVANGGVMKLSANRALQLRLP